MHITRLKVRNTCCTSLPKFQSISLTTGFHLQAFLKQVHRMLNTALKYYKVKFKVPTYVLLVTSRPKFHCVSLHAYDYMCPSYLHLSIFQLAQMLNFSGINKYKMLRSNVQADCRKTHLLNV